jgi:hypothetical protein
MGLHGIVPQARRLYQLCGQAAILLVEDARSCDETVKPVAQDGFRMLLCDAYATP